MVLPTERHAAAPSPWKHLSINKISIFEEKDAKKADIEYIEAPKSKIGFLPYLSENGPDKIWPKAKKIKYNVKISCVSSKDIFKSFLMIVKAGAIIVIPITGIATITANNLILGFVKFEYHSTNYLKL